MDKVSMYGCDLHDESGLVKWAVDRGTPQKFSFGNNREAREKLIEKLKAQAQAAGAARIIFAYEAGPCGFVLHDQLRAAGIEAYVLAPSKMQKSVKQRKHKCDEKDCDDILAHLRAHLLAGNKLAQVIVPDPSIRDAREVTRARGDIARKLTRTKLQIRHLLKRHDIEQPKDLKTGKFTRKYQHWIKGLCAAKSSLGVGTRTVLASLLRQARELLKEVKLLDEALLVLASAPEHCAAVEAVITELKGVGVYSALVVKLELADPLRFANRQVVGAVGGLVPSSHETGKTGDRKGHVTKQGSPHLRRVLCQCAWARIRVVPKEREFYERIKRNDKKRTKIALVAVMRRLLIQIWHTLVRVVQKQQGGAASARPAPAETAPAVTALAAAH